MLPWCLAVGKLPATASACKVLTTAISSIIVWSFTKDWTLFNCWRMFAIVVWHNLAVLPQMHMPILAWIFWRTILWATSILLKCQSTCSGTSTASQISHRPRNILFTNVVCHGAHFICWTSVFYSVLNCWLAGSKCSAS